MPVDSANVDVALSGAIYIAPAGTALPTGVDSVLDPAYKELGYISSDGVTETRDRSTSNIVAWQNADVVRAVITEASMNYQFIAIETKKDVIEFYYQGSVDEDGGIEIKPGATTGRKVIVVDYIDGTKKRRAVAPQGELLEVGDQTLTSSGDAVGYDMTVRAYPDGTLGYSVKKFYSELVVTP